MASFEDLVTFIERNNTSRIRQEIDDNNSALFETFKNGNSLFHHLIRASLDESAKITFIYMLSDAGLDINLQNNREQTALHLAVQKGLTEVVSCLLENGSDLTIVDQADFCAYNHARRLEDKELSRKIVKIMQSYFPTYWIGIDQKDMNIIRRLINSWCRFKVKRKGQLLIDYARQKQFQPAIDIFNLLEIQMDLCSAVLASNIKKCESIIKNNYSSLIINFKNMKEKGGSIILYAVKQKNLELLKCLLQLKPNILNEYISDELDIDYPIYFAALKENINEDCLMLLTPEITKTNKDLNIANLYYKGYSVLRYAISIDFDLQILKNILNDKYCSKELLTVRDPEFLTPREYALQNGKNQYVELIDKIILEYIINSSYLRMQLALNGFDFFDENLLIENLDLLNYAKKHDLKELIVFLENVKSYQKHIHNFHRAVEKNDYYNVKSLHKIEMDLDGFITDEIFIDNIIESKRKNESQTVFHKAVLNSSYEILNLLLEAYADTNVLKRVYSKMDQIKDHCYRTPYHYAMGMEINEKMCQLLSQFGFSSNVFDKDGMTPLDFQERIISKELQELIEIHKNQEYINNTVEEPNPWSWAVWTRIQREKDGLKQLLPVAHPCLHHPVAKPMNSCHGHSHHNHDDVAPLTINKRIDAIDEIKTISSNDNGYYSNCNII